MQGDCLLSHSTAPPSGWGLLSNADSICKLCQQRMCADQRLASSEASHTILCRGRVSSRAALFGNGDDAGSSSDGEEGSSSDGEDDGEQQQQQQDDVQEHGRPQFTSPSRLRVVAVSPDRDLSRVSKLVVTVYDPFSTAVLDMYFAGTDRTTQYSSGCCAVRFFQSQIQRSPVFNRCVRFHLTFVCACTGCS